MAKRLYRVSGAGRIVLDYDPAIGDAFRADSPAPDAMPDLWPAFEALAGAGPVLVVRGDRSDILSAATAGQMAQRLPTELVTVPRTGHAPTLDEPEAVAATARWLERIDDGR